MRLLVWNTLLTEKFTGAILLYLTHNKQKRKEIATVRISVGRLPSKNNFAEIISTVSTVSKRKMI